MSFQCPAYWDDSLWFQTGTIPFDMRRESADFPGAVCDKTKDSSDGCGWWYVNSWALGPNKSGKNNESLEREP
jgi:hypothetical protein